MNQQYTAKSIKVLSDIEHIKLRKSMYIGDGQDPRQLIFEVIDNAVDEVQSRYSEKVVVSIDTKNNIYEVRDYGRGIPHGKKSVGNNNDLEILEVLCTISKSGGKFDSNSYRHSIGLHGMGVTITNALSELFQVESYINKKCVRFISEYGIKKKLEYTKTTKHNGTYVRFKPDKKQFISDIIPIDIIKDRCRITSALGFKSELIVDGIEIDTNYTIHDLIKEDDDTIITYQDIDVIDITDDKEDKMKVAIRYTSDTTNRYFGYTNLLYNSIGGTHINTLSKAITQAWKDLIAKHKNLTPDVTLRDTDYLLGLRAVCAVFLSETQFSSQTKEKLVNDKRDFEDMMDRFKKSFVKYLSNNIVLAQSLIMRFTEYRIAQDKLLARKEISSLIKVNNDNADNIRRRSVVAKLKECTSSDRKNTELYLTEGDSSAGPASRARDRNLQAVLPLKGKITNVTNMDVKQALKSEEICNILNSIGCGVGSQCDSSKSRYERVIILSDADPDGKNIICLVLSVFINLLPDIVRDGRLYIAEPPLYAYTDKKGVRRYCDDLDEVPKGFLVTRFKGIGEMSDDELRETCMDFETRKIYQVEYPSDVNKFNHILGTSAGKSELLKGLGIVEYLD